MRKKIIGILVSMLLIATSTALADWDPDDGHKMHYPQLPDPEGWDVYATGGLPQYPVLVLADDWKCSQSGPITEIHFWGSWLHDTIGDITFFIIAIHCDIPADPPNVPYSRPGDILWERDFDVWKERSYDTPGQGFLNPATGEVIYDDHHTYIQYNIIDIPEPFEQEEGKIYWLSITAYVAEAEPDAFQPLWGWKSSRDHWNDDACWAYRGELAWIDLWEPQLPPVTNEFMAEMGPDGMLIWGDGSDYYDDGTSMNGWYYYKNTRWWNIWFYDHPFDPERHKEITVHFEWWATGPEAWIEFAINWAQPPWPPGDPPPIPPLTPDEEDMYIAREILPIIEEGPQDFTFVIEEYNPEWVSIDIRGANFIIPQGIIIHECIGEPQSLDLAFVINGKEPIPDLQCSGKLQWREIEPGSTVTGTFTVSNVGDPGSLLDWSVCGTPSWGTWTFTPSSGTGLTPAGSPVTVTATCVAPNQQNEEFTGNITICNDNDASDTCQISVTLATPRNTFLNDHPLLRFVWNIIDNFPLLRQLFSTLFALD